MKTPSQEYVPRSWYSSMENHGSSFAWDGIAGAKTLSRIIGDANTVRSPASPCLAVCAVTAHTAAPIDSTVQSTRIADRLMTVILLSLPIIGRTPGCPHRGLPAPHEGTVG